MGDITVVVEPSKASCRLAMAVTMGDLNRSPAIGAEITNLKIILILHEFGNHLWDIRSKILCCACCVCIISSNSIALCLEKDYVYPFKISKESGIKLQPILISMAFNQKIIWMRVTKYREIVMWSELLRDKNSNIFRIINQRNMIQYRNLTMISLGLFKAHVIFGRAYF